MAEEKPQYADAEIDALLSDLNATFGKRPSRTRGVSARKKDASVLGALSSAKGQLTRIDMSTEEFELHREMLLANELSKHMDLRPSWIPEARLTFVIRQHCDTCGENVDFIGGEYVRFRSKRERAVITRRAEVCTDLLHYGYAGVLLPDLVEKHYQVVARCPGCILVEEKALEIWNAATQQEEQLELDLDRPKAASPLRPNQLKSLVEHEFGEKWKRPPAQQEEPLDE